MKSNKVVIKALDLAMRVDKTDQTNNPRAGKRISNEDVITRVSNLLGFKFDYVKVKKDGEKYEILLKPRSKLNKK